MSQSSMPNADAIAKDLADSLQGKLDQSKIDDIVDSLKTDMQRYPATGSVASMIFYLQFTVNITNGKRFDGKAGGVSTPGGGALFGDVYTSDINRLYNTTHSFQFTGTPVYLSIVFFDSNSNNLGTFQSGGLSTVVGTGGGTGGWS